MEEFNIMKIWSGWAHTLRTGHHRQKSTDPVIMDDNQQDNHDNNEKLSGQRTDDPSNLSDEADCNDNHHTTVTSKLETQSTPRPVNISYEEMSDIGLKVKRLFDYGRIEYMKRCYLFQAEQIQYCDPILSPECVMIIGTYKSSGVV
jgi:hypothetical protein